MSCIFCRMVSREIPSKIVHETDSVFAFEDINPQAPLHILVIPKDHVTEVNGLEKTLPGIFKAISSIAAEKGVDKSGYRIVMNKGKDSGQEVEHLHFHLLGGRQLHWPPG